MGESLALAFGARDCAALMKRPPLDANKYTRGTIGVIGGSEAYPGAPILAAKAAARCGAGYVRLVVPKGALPCAKAHLLSIPVTGCEQGLSGTFCESSVTQAREALKKSEVLLVGPGMDAGEDSERFLRALGQDRPMVLDADALNIIARNRTLLSGSAQHPRVLTPHEGEAARLLGRPVSSRNEDACTLARAFDAVVVLKGQHTLVASPMGELRLIDEGGVELAKAGTGDVLGGMIASFLCQKISPFDAASIAVFVHGLAAKIAAQELSIYAVMPEDIISKIGPALLHLEARSSS